MNGWVWGFPCPHKECRAHPASPVALAGTGCMNSTLLFCSCPVSYETKLWMSLAAFQSAVTPSIALINGSHQAFAKLSLRGFQLDAGLVVQWLQLLKASVLESTFFSSSLNPATSVMVMVKLTAKPVMLNGSGRVACAHPLSGVGVSSCDGGLTEPTARAQTGAWPLGTWFSG